MTPSKFIAYQERRIGRLLTVAEKDCLNEARDACTSAKRDTVEAMRSAWKDCLNPQVLASLL